jgi:hypothetical protein
LESGQSIPRTVNRDNPNAQLLSRRVAKSRFQPGRGQTVTIQHRLALGIAVFGIAEPAAIIEPNSLVLGIHRMVIGAQ